MLLHLLLTQELKNSIPNTVKITRNFGNIEVIFPNDYGEEGHLFGDNVFVEAEINEMIMWLKPFNDNHGIVVGYGAPQMEQFRIMYIKNELL
jgi:hypothetical protein